MSTFSVFFFKHVTMEDSYLCGYLKIKGLTEVRGVIPFIKPQTSII